MNRSEFVKEVAAKVSMSQKDVKAIVDVMQDVVFTEMAAEGEVKIFDGVTLYGKHSEAKTARNPLTGEAVAVPEKTAPKAKFGAAVKAALNA